MAERSELRVRNVANGLSSLGVARPFTNLLKKKGSGDKFGSHLCLCRII